MKKKQLVIWICAGVMLMMSGCTRTVLSHQGTEEQFDVSAESEEYNGASESEQEPEEILPSEEPNGTLKSEQEPEEILPSEEYNGMPETQSEASESPVNTDDGTKQDTMAASDELQCDVLSVDYNNRQVTGNEIFTESDDEGSQTAVVLVGDGGELVQPVTVSFQEDIRYTLQIIRNGGADVTTQEAAFSDIREGDILALQGKRTYNEGTGDTFLASEVIISRVISE